MLIGSTGRRQRIKLLAATTPAAEGGRRAQQLARRLVECAVARQWRPAEPVAVRGLPAEAAASLRRESLGSPASWSAAVDEYRLLSAIRGLIAASPAAARHPRLVVSSSGEPLAENATRYRQAKARYLQLALREAQGRHRQQIRNQAGQWNELAYSHDDLIMSPQGSADLACLIRDFLQ